MTIRPRGTFTLAILAIAMAGVLCAPAAQAQETVIGFFEGPRGGLNAGSGAIGVVGWALADSGIKRVTIQVDGVDVGEALYGQFRPLVQDLYPDYIDSAGAGFGYNLNSTDFANGQHDVSAKVETWGGTIEVIPAVDPQGSLIGLDWPVTFTNNTTILVPFGDINFPERNADLFGVCDRTNPNRRYSVVSGWALDLGVEIGDAGLGWAELLVDGVIIANTRTGCFFNFATGGLTNCYGLPRVDIERRFPFAIDAPSSGYRFVMDVGFLLDNGWVQGHHTLTIRAGDISNQNANIAEIPVNFLCIENQGNEGAFGQIESPRPGRAFADLMTFQGWALDWEGVAAVELFVDGDSIGFADFGVGLGSRPFVLNNYPGYPNSLDPVWRLDNFDSTDLSEGFHQVQVFVTDLVGNTKLMGETTFLVNNVFD